MPIISHQQALGAAVLTPLARKSRRLYIYSPTRMLEKLLNGFPAHLNDSAVFASTVHMDGLNTGNIFVRSKAGVGELNPNRNEKEQRSY